MVTFGSVQPVTLMTVYLATRFGRFLSHTSSISTAAPVTICTRALSGSLRSSRDVFRTWLAKEPPSFECNRTHFAPECWRAAISFIGSPRHRESQTTMACQCGLLWPLCAGKKPRYGHTRPPLSETTMAFSSRAARHFSELGVYDAGRSGRCEMK